MTHVTDRLSSALSGRYRIERTTPVPVFPRQVPGSFGATVDGQQFVLARHNPAADARELNVVVNWDAVVRAKGKP